MCQIIDYSQWDSQMADNYRIGVLHLSADIHCLQSPTSNLFTAFLRPPEGQKGTSPVLEAKPTADEDLCLITETNLNSVFALDLNRLEECGVKACSVDGEKWLCLLVRFPIMSGLKLPEDEVIEIKCKPQEPSVEGRNVINFQKNAWVELFRLVLRCSNKYERGSQGGSLMCTVRCKLIVRLAWFSLLWPW